MSEERFNKIFGIFGDRGTGKTQYALGNEDFDLPGVVNLYRKRGIKVIIIDTMDHPAYKKIPVIPMQKFHLFTAGIGRIIVNADDIPQLNYFLNDHKTTWNSLLLYEDARKHTYGKVDKSLIRLIGDSKQKNIDIGFMYHCFAHCPLDLYRYFDFIDLFKTKDTPEVRKDALQGCFADVMQVYNEVKAHKSRFYHKVIDTGTD